MARSEQRRQNKLAKKQARDRRKRKEAVRQQQQLASLAGRMIAASQGRIVHCGITEAVRQAGIGYVLLARQAPMGQVAVVLIMVDVYCLGVKDASGSVMLPSEADEMFQQLINDHELQTVSPGLARGLVEGVIEYARSLGFEPHPDYRKVAPLWGDVEAESVEGKYEFGSDGKPLYIRGPHDDFAKQQFVAHTLEKTVGSGNYNVRLIDPAWKGLLPSYVDRYDDGADDEDGEDIDEEFATKDVFDNSIDAPEYRRLDPEHP